MKKILIGSCGGLTGYYLCKKFREYNEIEIWGMDAGDPRATQFLLDKYVKSPPAKEEKAFISFLIDLFNLNYIDYYLPTHSQEILVVSKYEKIIREKTNTKFVVSPLQTFQALNRKDEANRNLQRIGLYVPHIYEKSDENKYPLFCKPREASGSKDTFVVHNKEELEMLKNIYKNLMYMEYLNGDEYTVDAFFDMHSNLITYNQRIRILQQGGATVLTKNDYTIDVYDDLITISKRYPCKGVVNFQFFLQEGKAYYTDINLRYASGGLPLSVESGLKIVPLLLSILEDEKIDFSNYQSDRKNRTMYRFYEERYQIDE